MQEQIITVQIYPPIPTRNYDWMSYRSGNEETGPFGWGATKEDAETDLLDLEELDSNLN